ncbi:MAG: polyamine aminopropyltransferase [Melioribacteraceae bacterium]|nr:polyamine aminopropyltransferase [Melioribacteraceae bacterium]
MKLKSNILKIAIFATGLSGIVAEYILSTLATYFLGDSVFQWSMIVSVMLFSMGLGSRISKYFNDDLLVKFIAIEFVLSLLVSFSPLLAYITASFTIYTGLIIYLLSILIGLMIGMEIPLVIRINDEMESLRVNVSSVIENDYYGSLLGGLFFAFVALPYLGLTYTPFILGFINFSVAIFLFIVVSQHIKPVIKSKLVISAVSISIILVIGFFSAKPIIIFGEQNKYKDKVIYSEQSRYQKIVLTEWKGNHWLYINGNQQLSTLDEIMYHEPLIHPIVNLSENPANVLVLGGGDGCAVRELLKYEAIKNITLVDLDPVMIEFAKTNPIMTEMNDNSLLNPKVDVKTTDGYIFVEETKDFYDIIIIDLPDPRTIELGRLYSLEFYKKCFKLLRPNGLIITQAGSPYYATNSFRCIDKTLKSADFNTIMLHNQILTMGEWGWVLGSKNIKTEKLLENLHSLEYKNIDLKWLNNESMKLLTSFGKNIYNIPAEEIKINTIHDPVLYRYYLNGNWDIY